LPLLAPRSRCSIDRDILPLGTNVLLHDLLVVDSVSDINVGGKRELADCRIKVKDIRRLLLGV
jgi:hypothetical protein